jgi:hypothetical protein
MAIKANIQHLAGFDKQKKSTFYVYHRNPLGYSQFFNRIASCRSEEQKENLIRHYYHKLDLF